MPGNGRERSRPARDRGGRRGYGGLPAGYDVDVNAVEIGRGPACFERARQAVRRWVMFDLSWVRVCDGEAAIAAGTIQGVVMRTAGLWSVNLSRIVYTVDSEASNGEPARFGFAYGTLVQHLEMGEERFLVTHDPVTDAVVYDLLAFSRPRHPLARLAYPLARAMQRRFVTDSQRAMARAVDGRQAHHKGGG